MFARLAAFAKAGLGAVNVVALPAHAAVFTTYTDLASFTAAVGGPLQLQDFEGYAAGTNLSGVEFLPGLSAMTNMNSLEVFGTGGSNTMFVAVT